MPTEFSANGSDLHIQDARAGFRSLPGILWLLVALAVSIRVGIAITTGYTAEDYLITLRYAENIASGRGFVYNPGEKVLGTTAPLYTLFLAFLAWLGLPATAFGKATNILADGVLCLALYRWMRQIGRKLEGIIAAGLLAGNTLSITWSLSGMEASLAALCGVAAWMVYARRRYVAAYALLAVLFLLRWDGLLLLAVLTTAVAARDRRLPVRELSLFLLLAAPWLLFATWYFGSPVPASVTSKAAVSSWRFASQYLPWWPSFLYQYTGTPLRALTTAAALIGLYRLVCAQEAAHARSLLIPPVLWFVLYWIAFLASKVMLFGWYFVPPLPVYMVLAAWGIMVISEWLRDKARRPLPRVTTSLAYVALLGYLLYGTVRVGIDRRSAQRVQSGFLMRTGLRLKQHSQPTDTVMAEGIGYIGYYSQRRILDTVGLVTPEVLRYCSDRNTAPPVEIALAFRPEWCVLRPHEVQQARALPPHVARQWEAEYRLVKILTYPPDSMRTRFVFLIFSNRAAPNGPVR